MGSNIRGYMPRPKLIILKRNFIWVQAQYCLACVRVLSQIICQLSSVIRSWFKLIIICFVNSKHVFKSPLKAIERKHGWGKYEILQWLCNRTELKYSAFIFSFAVLNIDHSFHWQKQPLIKYHELSPSILPSWEISENSILEMWKQNALVCWNGLKLLLSGDMVAWLQFSIMVTKGFKWRKRKEKKKKAGIPEWSQFCKSHLDFTRAEFAASLM